MHVREKWNQRWKNSWVWAECSSVSALTGGGSVCGRKGFQGSQYDSSQSSCIVPQFRLGWNKTFSVLSPGRFGYSPWRSCFFGYDREITTDAIYWLEEKETLGGTSVISVVCVFWVDLLSLVQTCCRAFKAPAASGDVLRRMPSDR